MSTTTIQFQFTVDGAATDASSVVLRDPTGQKVWPGLPPGSEPFWGPLTNPTNPFPIAISYYRWVVFGDPNWDWKAFDLANPAITRAISTASADMRRS